MAKTKITVELSSLRSMGFVPAQVQICKKGSHPGQKPVDGDAAVRWGSHHPMEHIMGFTRRHWMLPYWASAHITLPRG